jgi:hypothetical protein
LFPETLRDASIGSISRVTTDRPTRLVVEPAGHEADKKKPRNAGFKSRRKRP